MKNKLSDFSRFFERLSKMSESRFFFSKNSTQSGIHMKLKNVKMHLNTHTHRVRYFFMFFRLKQQNTKSQKRSIFWPKLKMLQQSHQKVAPELSSQIFGQGSKSVDLANERKKIPPRGGCAVLPPPWTKTI